MLHCQSAMTFPGGFAPNSAPELAAEPKSPGPLKTASRDRSASLLSTPVSFYRTLVELGIQLGRGTLVVNDHFAMSGDDDVHAMVAAFPLVSQNLSAEKPISPCHARCLMGAAGRNTNAFLGNATGAGILDAQNDLDRRRRAANRRRLAARVVRKRQIGTVSSVGNDQRQNCNGNLSHSAYSVKDFVLFRANFYSQV